MDNTPDILLTVDTPEPGVLRLVLSDPAGEGELASQDIAYSGHVDNILLTGVDNLLKRSKLHKSSLKSVALGQGIDKNSSLYRIIQSLSAAITAGSGSTGNDRG
jgi:hypothetical protein